MQHISRYGKDEKYGNKALYSCIGINSEGKREILPYKLCDSETEMEWELI